eukprot:scaffold22568_cov125-Cylindrotheca_fusiformis.AAC.22
MVNLVVYLRCKMPEIGRPDIDETAFEPKDWTTSDFSHVQGEEERPPNASPRGFRFFILLFGVFN